MSTDSSLTCYEDVCYTSSRDQLELYADFYFPPEPAPLLLFFHGWHQTRIHSRWHARLLARYFAVVNVDMRGRGRSAGKPDVNGWELLDGIDAVNYARRAFAHHISDPSIVYCVGGSGGGGNTLAALAKFPDFFAAGVALCGISDYALWYEGDKVGEFRDDMDPWIGKSPAEAPDAYRGRSGLHLLPNVQAPLLIYHGSADPRVPVLMSRLYKQEADRLGKEVVYCEMPGAGHKLPLDQLVPDITDFLTQHNQACPQPERGTWRIGGYLQTRCERIELPSIDNWTEVRYEIAADGHVQCLDWVGGENVQLSVVPVNS